MIARSAKCVEAHCLLGTLLQQKGETEGAIAEFRETIRIRPASAEAYLSLGQALRKKGDQPDDGSPPAA